jgi:N-acetylmuramoyl-L-alanine amidase
VCAALAWALAPAAQGALIAVDAGHYPSAPGPKSATGIAEVEYNLALAEEVRRALEAAGHKARRIRQNPDPRRRAGEATGADLLISLHHDALDAKHQAQAAKITGFSLFVSRRNRDPQTSERCAAAIGAQLRRIGMQPSRYHADPVLGENLAFADETNGVHYYDEMPLARAAGMPMVMLEAGMISNPAEAKRLAAPAVRKRIAGAVAQGIGQCLR